jgi:hypothetical protein
MCENEAEKGDDWLQFILMRFGRILAVKGGLLLLAIVLSSLAEDENCEHIISSASKQKTGKEDGANNLSKIENQSIIQKIILRSTEVLIIIQASAYFVQASKDQSGKEEKTSLLHYHDNSCYGQLSGL